MTVIPGATAVTTPLDDTVANAVADDVHVDVLVTFCVEPSLIVAIAVNCEVEPMSGVLPVTATDVTVLADVEVEPHAAAPMAARQSTRTRIIDRIFIRSFLQGWHVRASRPCTCAHSAPRHKNLIH